MNAGGFTSALAPHLEAYLAFKETMGFHGASRIWYLKQFDAYCTAHERTVFDRDTVEGWVRHQLTRSGRYRSWMSYIRDVGRWLRAHGQREAYVLSDRWKAPVVPAHPYLLHSDEIEAFFATLKSEIGTKVWPTRQAARRDVFAYLAYYNYDRLHSTNGYRTPVETRLGYRHGHALAA